MAIIDSILSAVGNTPLIELKHVVPEGGRVFAKLEYLNPSGSIKDRIIKPMIEDAVARGLLKEGGTIVEPTSGNTGISMAFIAAAMGYKAVLVMPETMSKERVSFMRSYGAEIVLTPGNENMDGSIRVAKEIAEHEWDERCYEFRARKLGVGEIPAEVIVPTHDWGTFTDDCYKGFEEMRMEAGGVIGVMVDRATTLFMPYYFKDDEMLTGMLSFGFNFYLGDVAAQYGGRTTGFGVFFAWNLDNIHNAATVGKMRELKTVLDTHDVVNPGHVVCGTTRFGIDLTKGIMGLGSTMMQTIKKLMPKDRAFAYNLKRFRYNDLEDQNLLKLLCQLISLLAPAVLIHNRNGKEQNPHHYTKCCKHFSSAHIHSSHKKCPTSWQGIPFI